MTGIAQEKVFNEAMRELMRDEGGYVNDPSDAGGETFAGISRRWYPKWSGWSIIDQMPDKKGLSYPIPSLEAAVRSFYYDFYWLKIGANLIDDDLIAKTIFNFSINLGSKTVAKKVQRILKVTQDGVIGPLTMATLNRQDPEKFMLHFLLEIIEGYVAIAAKGDNRKFFRGWVSRAVRVYHELEHRL